MEQRMERKGILGLGEIEPKRDGDSNQTKGGNINGNEKAKLGGKTSDCLSGSRRLGADTDDGGVCPSGWC